MFVPGPNLVQKHLTRLERLARGKHSSLLRKSVNYGRNKFYSTGPKAGERFDETFSCVTYVNISVGRVQTIFSKYCLVALSPEMAFTKKRYELFLKTFF